MARAQCLTNRIRDELGYTSVKAWPIYERQNGGKIMYFMIHATDHPAAPMLMNRAYTHAVLPVEPMEQLSLDLGSMLGIDTSGTPDANGENNSGILEKSGIAHIRRIAGLGVTDERQCN